MSNKYKIEDVDKEFADFYRRAPLIVAAPQEPFLMTSEVREFRIPQKVEEFVRHERRPKQNTLGVDPPPAPTIFDTDHGRHNVTLHWHPVTDPATGGQGSVRYSIFRNITGFGEFTRIVSGITGGTGSDRTYDDTGLPSDTDIYYYMIAVGEGGDSEHSDPLTIVHTDAEPPPGMPPGAIFDVVGTTNIIVGAGGTHNYLCTMRAEPTYAGGVLFDTSIFSPFITVFAFGGAIVFSGVPTINVSPSNPQNMVAGVCTFAVNVTVVSGVPSGGHCVGSFRFRLANPANIAEPHQIFGDPISQPNFFEVHFQ